MYIATNEEYLKSGHSPPNCLYVEFVLGQKFFIVKCFKDGSVIGLLNITPRDWQEFCALMRLAISAHPYRGEKRQSKHFWTHCTPPTTHPRNLHGFHHTS